MMENNNADMVNVVKTLSVNLNESSHLNQMYTKSLATQHLIELVWKMRSLSFFFRSVDVKNRPW